MSPFDPSKHPRKVGSTKNPGEFASKDEGRGSAGQVIALVDESPTLDSLPGARKYSEVDRSERMAEMQQDLADSIQTIVESDSFEEYLAAMASSRMGNWSFSNRLLALMQLEVARSHMDDDDPAKTLPRIVMSLSAWKEKYGKDVHPKKGTSAIWIAAPYTRKIEEADANGKMEEKYIVTGFRPQAEWDIAQLDGGSLPTDSVSSMYDMPAPNETVSPGVIEGLKSRVEALGYKYQEREFPGADPAKTVGKIGETNFGAKTITIDSRCSDAQKVGVIAHELGHAILHGEERTCRGQEETEAEGVAYLVARSLGVKDENLESTSAKYIAGWCGGKMSMVTDSMNRIGKAYNQIMDGEWPNE